MLKACLKSIHILVSADLTTENNSCIPSKALSLSLPRTEEHLPVTVSLALSKQSLG